LMLLFTLVESDDKSAAPKVVLPAG
jgi:hypothetical protein